MAACCFLPSVHVLIRLPPICFSILHGSPGQGKTDPPFRLLWLAFKKRFSRQRREGLDDFYCALPNTTLDKICFAGGQGDFSAAVGADFDQSSPEGTPRHPTLVKRANPRNGWISPTLGSGGVFVRSKLLSRASPSRQPCSRQSLLVLLLR